MTDKINNMSNIYYNDRNNIISNSEANNINEGSIQVNINNSNDNNNTIIYKTKWHSFIGDLLFDRVYSKTLNF